MTDVTVVLGTQEVLIDLDASVALTSADAARAEAAADAAELARDVAVTAGPHYASIAAGEAATTTGQTFAVAPGDGTVIWYRRTGGGSTEIFEAATAADLAEIGHTLAFTRLPFPPTQPTLAVGAAGALTGTYSGRVSFVNAAGEETDVSAGSNSVTVSAQRIEWTNIPIGPAGTVKRRLYRPRADAVDQVLGKLVAEIADNTTTTYSDNVADGSLGADAPYYNATGGQVTINGAPFLTSGVISTSLGNGAGIRGYANTFSGANAGSAVTIGFRNSGFGVDALQNITTGYENTAAGVHALGATITAIQSCAFGYGALENANANYNAAFGTKAMSSTTSGTQNAAMGCFALQLVTTGSNNAALGYNAGYGITTGSGNTAAGMEAGKVVAAGNFNSYFGFKCGIAATGSSNTGVGFLALNSLTSGEDNVAIGANAGKSITTGAGNTFIGPSAGNNATQKVDAFLSIAIGYGTYCDRDHQVVLGDPSVNETILRGVMRHAVYTASTIPLAASTAGAGARTFISDSTVAASGNFGAPAAGGGSNFVPLYSDGTNWLVG